MLVAIESIRNRHTPLEDFIDSCADKELIYYASDLLQQRGCRSIQELRQAVRRATEVCKSMHLPLRENIKVVYRSQHGEVVQDWRLSPLAYMLMVINADAQNDLVARLQVEMVRRALNL